MTAEKVLRILKALGTRIKIKKDKKSYPPRQTSVLHRIHYCNAPFLLFSLLLLSSHLSFFLSMDCVSPILDVATRLWDCTAKRAVYIRELQENLNTLKILTEELSYLSKDVMESVEREEQLKESKRTHEVDCWLRAVQIMETQVGEILQNGDQEIQNKCLGTCCPKNCRSSYRLGKIVSKKIKAVTELTGRGHFDCMAHSLPCAPVDERPTRKTVGLDLMFDKVRKCLKDEQVKASGCMDLGVLEKLLP